MPLPSTTRAPSVPVAVFRCPEETPIGTGRGNRSVGARASDNSCGHALDWDVVEFARDPSHVVLLPVDPDNRLAGPVDPDAYSRDAGQVEEPFGMPLLRRKRLVPARRIDPRRRAGLAGRCGDEQDRQEGGKGRNDRDPSKQRGLSSEVRLATHPNSWNGGNTRRKLHGPADRLGNVVARADTYERDLSRGTRAERGTVAGGALRRDRIRARAEARCVRGGVRRRRLDRRQRWAFFTGCTTSSRTSSWSSLRRNFGKAAALQAGFLEANGEIVVTIDADLQDDPAEIPQLLAKLDEGFDLVSGWKTRRNDPLPRRVFSRIFNWATGVISGVRLHDVNCGLKAYRAEVLQGMRIYGELHRFIPVLAAYQGFRDRRDPRQPPGSSARAARATGRSATCAGSSTCSA